MLRSPNKILKIIVDHIASLESELEVVSETKQLVIIGIISKLDELRSLREYIEESE